MPRTKFIAAFLHHCALVDGRRQALVSVALAALLLVAAASAEDAAPSDVASLVARQVALLADADPALRAEAASRLADLAKHESTSREQLAAEFQAHLLARETSIEARLLLRQLIKELPIPAPPDNLRATPDEIRALIAELDSPEYRDRLAPQAKLYWLSGGVQPACVIVTELKTCFARADLNESLRQQLEAVWDHARWTWLSSPQSRWDLPSITDQELDSWLRELSLSAEGDERSRQRRRNAERDLIDAIVRDDTRDRVASRLDERLAAATDEEAKNAIQELRDWIGRPTIVAEIWRRDIHTGVQHLFVGVPQFPEGGITSTFFDWANEQQAHLASGNVLRPDTYDVGVAFLPPPGSRIERWPGASLYYHLVYQPTPQRRLLYRYELERSQAARYFEISLRTVRKMSERMSPNHLVLSSSDAALLLELHSRAVSQFLADEIEARIVPNLVVIADEPVDASSANSAESSERDAEANPLDAIDRAMDEGSLEAFEVACGVLLQNGALVALPTLVKVADAPASLAMRDAAWAATLAIIQRDTTNDGEQWLARWLTSETTLGFNDLSGRAPRASDVGATAAAMLLRRLGRKPADFGLEPVASYVPQRLLPPQLGPFYQQLVGYRYHSPDDRERFISWWRGRVDARAADLSARETLGQPAGR